VVIYSALVVFSIFFSFFFDLWGILLVFLLLGWGVFKLKKIPAVFSPLLLLLLFEIFKIFVVKDAFNHLTFILELYIYFFYFLLGFYYGARKFLFVILSFAILPFFSFFYHLNINILSGFIVVLIAYVWLTDLTSEIKIPLTFLGLFYILRSFSLTAFFILALSFAFVRKRFFILVLLLLAGGIFVARSSLFERLLWISETIRIFLKNPLGVGFFSIKNYLAEVSFQGTIFTHSFLFQFLAEAGIISFLLLLFFLSKVSKIVLPERRFSFWVCLLCLLFDFSVYYTGIGALLFFVMGASCNKKSCINSRISLFIFKGIYIPLLAAAFVLFSISRNFAEGNYYLVKGMPEKANFYYEKSLPFPEYPALNGARALTKLLLYDKTGDKETFDFACDLLKKAIVYKSEKNPVWRMYEEGKKNKNSLMLKESAARILFLEGINLNDKVTR